MLDLIKKSWELYAKSIIDEMTPMYSCTKDLRYFGNTPYINFISQYHPEALFVRALISDSNELVIFVYLGIENNDYIYAVNKSEEDCTNLDKLFTRMDKLLSERWRDTEFYKKLINVLKENHLY